MTITTLIIINAAAGLTAVWGIVHLLGHGIHTHRTSELGSPEADVRALPVRERERAAA